jgi:hypothetical protein
MQQQMYQQQMQRQKFLDDLAVRKVDIDDLTAQAAMKTAGLPKVKSVKSFVSPDGQTTLNALVTDRGLFNPTTGKTFVPPKGYKLATTGGVTNFTVDMAKNQTDYTNRFNLNFDKKYIDEATPKFRSLNQNLTRLNRISDILQSDDLMIGPFAEPRQFIARLGESLGYGQENALSKTAELVQGLARGQLDASEALKGQGVISDSERVIIRKAADGNIDFTKAELQTLNNALKSLVKHRIDTIKTDVGYITKRLKGTNQPVIDATKNPEAKNVLQKQLDAEIEFLEDLFFVPSIKKSTKKEDEEDDLDEIEGYS